MGNQGKDEKAAKAARQQQTRNLVDQISNLWDAIEAGDTTPEKAWNDLTPDDKN